MFKHEEKITFSPTSTTNNNINHSITKPFTSRAKKIKKNNNNNKKKKKKSNHPNNNYTPKKNMKYNSFPPPTHHHCRDPPLSMDSNNKLNFVSKSK